MEFNKQTTQVIAKQIGVKPQEFQYSIEKILEIIRADPDLLEIVKIWKVKQTSPDPFDWWEILVFNPTGGEDGDEYYVLLDVVKWGEGRNPEMAPNEENITWLNGDTKPIDRSSRDDHIVELIFESDTHVPNEFFQNSEEEF